MDEDRIGQLCELVGHLLDTVEAVQKEIAEIRTVVYDEIIGGVSKLYDANMRVEKVGGLREKYTDLFKDAEPAYGALTKGNLWEDLMDELEGVADEEVDGKVKALAADLLERIKAVKGEPEAVAVAVEEKPEEPAMEEDPMEGVRKEVERIKKQPGNRQY